MKFDLNKVYAWVIGFSLICFAFRNPFMQLGLVVGAMACVSILIPNAFEHKLTLGSKFICIPILVIVASIIASSIIHYFDDKNLSLMVGNSFMAVYFFALYLVARLLGKEIFKPFAWVVVIEAISVIVYSLFINYGLPNGGLASVENYNIATGILVFGSVVSAIYKKWVVVTVAVIGLFFTGSEEGIIAVAILLIAVLIMRDWGRKLLIPIGSVVIIAILGVVPFNYTAKLYALPINRVLFFMGQKTEIASYYQPPPELTSPTPPSQNITDNKVFLKMDYVLDGRLTFIYKAMTNLEPLGTGYVLYPDNAVDNPIHNVPLIIVEQVGIPAAIAWSFLVIYCLVKTKWKYAFVAVIGLSLFDNFIFTRVGLWLFSLIGVASVATLKSGLMFKTGA